MTGTAMAPGVSGPASVAVDASRLHGILSTMLSTRTVERLGNWKFSQAKVALDDQVQEVPTEEERGLIEALAATFENSGWFEGHLGVIVGAAVDSLIPTTEG